MLVIVRVFVLKIQALGGNFNLQTCHPKHLSNLICTDFPQQAARLGTLQCSKHSDCYHVDHRALGVNLTWPNLKRVLRRDLKDYLRQLSLKSPMPGRQAAFKQFFKSGKGLVLKPLFTCTDGQFSARESKITIY